MWVHYSLFHVDTKGFYIYGERHYWTCEVISSENGCCISLLLVIEWRMYLMTSITNFHSCRLLLWHVLSNKNCNWHTSSALVKNSKQQMWNSMKKFHWEITFYTLISLFLGNDNIFIRWQIQKSFKHLLDAHGLHVFWF